MKGEIIISETKQTKLKDVVVPVLSEEQKLAVSYEVFNRVDHRTLMNTLMGSDKPNGNLHLINYSDVRVSEVKWLMEPYIPLGKVTVVSGDPGTGKSTFVLDLCARLTSGEALPFCDEVLPPQKVIYLTTEDDASDTIKPRLLSSGGTAANFFSIDESIFPLSDFSDERIRDAVRKTKAKLLVIDPLSAYIGSETNVNMANQVRCKINALISLAADENIAVVIIAHLNKGSHQKALYRNSGSVDIIGGARSGLLVCEYSRSEPDLRAVIHIKSNLAKKGEAIVFRLKENGGIEYLRKEDIDADELINSIHPKKDKDDRRKLIEERIEQILEEYDGQAPQTAVEKELEGFLISKAALFRIKKEMGIKSIKEKEGWFWLKENAC